MNRSTGGNRFISHDSNETILLAAIKRGLDDLKEWAELGDETIDWGAVSVDTQRVRSGISVTVSADVIPPGGLKHYE